VITVEDHSNLLAPWKKRWKGEASNVTAGTNAWLLKGIAKNREYQSGGWRDKGEYAH